MTDKEIIQALECCSEENCNNCTQRNNEHDYVPDCRQSMLEVWLDLINRQQAEIKWLKEALQTQTYILESGANSYEPCFEKDKIRAEAIKEFAEKLITNIKEHYKRTAHGYSIAGWNYSVSDIETFVHNFVKEMEGRK